MKNKIVINVDINNNEINNKTSRIEINTDCLRTENNFVVIRSDKLKENSRILIEGLSKKSFSLKNKINTKYYIDIVRNIDNSDTDFLRIDSNTITGINMNYLNVADSYDIDNPIYVKMYKWEYASPETIGNLRMTDFNGRQRIYFAPRLNKNTEISKCAKIIGLIDQNLYTNDNDTVSFYIPLKKIFSGEIGNIGTFNILIDFEHYNGIPIENITGSLENPLTITKTSEGNCYIDTKIQGTSGIVLSSGSDNLSVVHVEKTGKCQKILEKPIFNVTKSRIISSVFTKKICNVTEKNNSIYWKNMDDDSLYGITIQTGYYCNDKYIKTLLKKMCDIMRKIRNNYGYTDKSLFKAKFINTRQILLKSYKTKTLKKPIVNISTEDNSTYFITISHTNHNLINGDKIKICDSLQTGVVPSENLNRKHYVYNTIDKDTYVIKLDNINPKDISIQSGGGNSFCVIAKNMFKLLNSEKYDYKQILEPDINMHRYFYINCEELKNEFNEHFAKINIDDKDTSLNTFVPMTTDYNYKIHMLDRLTLSYVYNDGTNVEFEDSTDLSFVIEIDIGNND